MCILLEIKNLKRKIKMKLNLKEERVASINAKPGTRIDPKDVEDAVKAQTGQVIDKDTAQKTAQDITKSGKAAVITKENYVTDSLGEELAIGDILEVQGKRFMVKESETGACLATMEGKCVMDVADPRARTLFENSKRVMDESYEPTSPQEPVLSVGHIDDEPGMLKQTAYDIVKYGADLYKILDRYEVMDAHVDLPHWIQSKIVLARDYISKATHYLEYQVAKPEVHTRSNSIQEVGNEAGLIVYPSSAADKIGIETFLNQSDYYGEWDEKFKYFFFPESKDMYDNLESELDKEFSRRNINVRFEVN